MCVTNAEVYSVYCSNSWLGPCIELDVTVFKQRVLVGHRNV